jgi:hypothetical protein
MPRTASYLVIGKGVGTAVPAQLTVTLGQRKAYETKRINLTFSFV